MPTGQQQRLIIPGNPIVKKNGMQIVRFGNRPSLQPSKRYRAATKAAVAALRRQASATCMWDGVPLHVKFMFYWTRAIREPDLSNLYEAPQDWLQAAEIISDDKWIHSHDGSRKVCVCDTCDKRPLITRGPRKGQRRSTCGHVKDCRLGNTLITIEAEFDPEAMVRRAQWLKEQQDA